MSNTRENLDSSLIWDKLENEHEKVCLQDPQYKEIAGQVEALQNEITQLLEPELAEKIMQYEVKRNLLVTIQIEAAYRIGRSE